MARPGFRNHPKFRRLVHILGMSEPHVLGHVECLWSVAYNNFGNPFIGDSIDVELAACWAGEPGKLCRALASCGGDSRAGLIEPDAERPGCWIIHDLADHAPSYVLGQASKEAQKQLPRECANCRGNFFSPDSRAKYCCDACKQEAFRKRKNDQGGQNSALLPIVTDAPSHDVTQLRNVTDRYASSIPDLIVTELIIPSLNVTQSPPAAAGVRGVGEALEKAGIEEPLRSEIAALPWVTAGFIHAAVENAPKAGQSVTAFVRGVLDRMKTQSRGKPKSEKSDKTEKLSHVPLPAELDTPRFRAAWARWAQHRREIGHALKPTMESSQLALLQGLGEERAIATIENSITAGWQKLVEPRAGPPGTATPFRESPQEFARRNSARIAQKEAQNA